MHAFIVATYMVVIRRAYEVRTRRKRHQQFNAVINYDNEHKKKKKRIIIII